VRCALLAAITACAAATATGARAESGLPPGGARLAALAPADDARRAIAIGCDGEVYEPDGKGAWVHRLPSSTAEPIVAAGRAGGAVVALGRGVIYRLAGNGWSAIRLVQHGTAILGEGARSLAAVGRQLFALDALTRGEPTRLVQAPGNIVSIGAGAGVGATAIVVATEAGVFRVTGGKLVAINRALGHPRLVSDRWAIVDRGAVDLTTGTGKLILWPRGLTIGAAAGVVGRALVAVGAGRAGLELVTVAGGNQEHEPLGVTGTAVGVVADEWGRTVVALSDGRIAVRDRAGWTITEVTDAPAAEHPGPAPAVSE
jgi:hypothetical protein